MSYLIDNIDKNCNICDELYDKNKTILTHTCCKKSICCDCNINWINKSIDEYTCPFCREINPILFHGFIINMNNFICNNCKYETDNLNNLIKHNTTCFKNDFNCKNRLFGCNWNINSYNEIEKIKHEMICIFKKFGEFNAKIKLIQNKIDNVLDNFDNRLKNVDKVLIKKKNIINRTKNKLGKLETEKFNDFQLIFSLIKLKKIRFKNMKILNNRKTKIEIDYNNNVLQCSIKYKIIKVKDNSYYKFKLYYSNNLLKKLNISTLIGIIILKKYYIGKQTDKNIINLSKSNIINKNNNITLFVINNKKTMKKFYFKYTLFFC